MQLQNPLRAICPALEADVLIALADGRPSTPGALVRERGVHASISGVRRCLERLEENGVVDVGHVGNRVEYSLNTRHMLAGLAVEASKATERFIQFLSDQISRWSERPLQVTLFGSAAARVGGCVMTARTVAGARLEDALVFLEAAETIDTLI